MNNELPMKLLILGAGAVGLSLAARLSAHCDVHAVCRKRHADIINANGFTMSGIWGDGKFRFSASTDIPDDYEFDYCLITSKSIQTRELCEQYRHLLKGKECVSFQNGIGNEEVIAGFTDRVIGGTIITGFEWRGDASVEVTVEAGPIRLGRFPEGSDPQVENLVSLFQQAGLNVEGSDRIRSNLWAKTLYNCALNPLGAILDVPYGKLAERHAWRSIEDVIHEAFAVCSAEHVDLPWDSAEAYLEYLKTVQLPATAGHHSSMLQDIRNGRETEIDFINGAIVRLGEKHGVATPVNQTLVNQIRFKTAQRCE